VADAQPLREDWAELPEPDDKSGRAALGLHKLNRPARE
jgi:hypothetical protein